MAESLAVIVSGPTCTGKTLLARSIAERGRIALLEKDLLKEAMFDALGWGDRELSRRYGDASILMLERFVSGCLERETSFVVEGNFRPQHWSSRFARLLGGSSARVVQVQCRVDGDVLVQRFVARSDSPERHPGHCDVTNLSEFEPELRRGYLDPLVIDAELIEVDNTGWRSTEEEAELMRRILGG